jgi:alginate O-acetyltransferase complex protein AlgI
LWHGAGWTFVIWGLLHGVLSCANKFFVVHFKRKEGGFLSVLVNFVFVTLLWVVFRCDNISNTLNYFKAMFTIHNGINQPYTWSLFAIVILVISSVMGIIQSKNMRNKIVIGYYPIQKLSTIKGLTIFFTVCGLAVIMGYFGETYFVYGAF